MRLDSNRIRQRRLELNLSQRALGLRLGWINSLVHLVERGDRDSSELTLREVDRLAEVLQVDPISLLIRDGETETTSVVDESEIVDPTVSRLGGLLLRVRDPVPVSVLVEIFGIRREDLDHLIEHAHQMLAQLGMSIFRHDDCVRLVPRDDVDIPPAMIKALHHRALSRRSIDRQQAIVLHATAGGKATAKPFMGNVALRAALRSLINAGLILEPSSDTEPLRLSPEVRESLMLDDSVA